jgi:hypothetical protein
MATAKQICAVAGAKMKMDAVIITGADFCGDTVEQLQVYFWDEDQAVMDIIPKADLIENWPDAGVFVIDAAAEKDNEVLRDVHIFDAEEDFYLRIGTDGSGDELGPIPAATMLEAIELISQLKERKF